jgi:hypothetical protein
MSDSLPADRFFNDVDFVSIVDTIKGIYMSDGSMSTLLDFERVLDEADLYAFKNWSAGELVEGPVIGRYTCKCIFMWPYKLMPDPRGGARLEQIGCEVVYGKSELKVPVEIKDYEDFVPGTRYPKMKERKVWFVQITIPIELMDDIKEGTIDLADQTIDLSDIEDAYNEDLDDSTKTESSSNTQADQNQQPQQQAPAGAPPMM